MIAKHYGRTYSIQKLREFCNINRMGVSMLGIGEAGERIGFRSQGVRLELDQLENAPLPCIIHWRKHHFVVLYKIAKGKYYIADPASGLVTYKKNEFAEYWLSRKQLHDGLALFLTPSPQFYQEEFPALRQIYEKYKHLGFDVIGVSTDIESDREIWLEALKNTGLYGLNSEIKMAYRVKAIQ